MPILDDTSIQALIEPSARELQAELHAVSGGQAGWVVELFEEWRRRAVVIKDRRGLWVFDHAKLEGGLAATREIVNDRIQEALGDESGFFDGAKQLLALAVLQGDTFSLEPIAELLGVELASSQALAAKLTHGAAEGALLEAVAELPLQGSAQPTHYAPRYRFVDRLVWSSLAQYGLSTADRRDAALRSAQILQRSHACDPASIAATLASLYHFAEDAAESSRWRDIANVSPSGDLLHWQVQAALEDEQQWKSWSHEQARRTAQFLLKASVVFSRVQPWNELYPLLEAVERLGALHNLNSERAAAVRLQGKVRAVAGEYDRARERFDAAERILGPAGDRHERSNLLCELAYLDSQQGDLAAAARRLDMVIEEYRSIQDPRAEAGALEERGQIALECGDTTRAERAVAAAIRLYRESNDGNGICSSLTTMSAVKVVRGDADDAIGLLREAVALAQSTGNRARELYARDHLGALIQDPTASYREHERALTLARELNDAHVEADSLLSLARRARALHDWAAARRFLQEGFELRKRLRDPVGEAWFLLEIGVVQIRTGALPQARRNLDLAHRAFAAQDAREGLAATHHALANLAARRGDRKLAKRELALATNLGAPADERAYVVHVFHQTRPRRSWRPEL